MGEGTLASKLPYSVADSCSFKSSGSISLRGRVWEGMGDLVFHIELG